MVNSRLTLPEREKLIKLAASGDQETIELIQKCPKFHEGHQGATAGRKILAKHGDVDAIAKSKEDERKLKNEYAKRPGRKEQKKAGMPGSRQLSKKAAEDELRRKMTDALSSTVQRPSSTTPDHPGDDDADMEDADTTSHPDPSQQPQAELMPDSSPNDTTETAVTNESTENNITRPYDDEQSHVEPMLNASTEATPGTIRTEENVESTGASLRYSPQPKVEPTSDSRTDRTVNASNTNATAENSMEHAAVTPPIKREETPDIIVISDDEMEDAPQAPNLNPKKAEYDLRKSRAAAGSQKAIKEIERMKLEDKLAGDDARGKGEARLKLKVVLADIKYYEKKLELAGFELGALRESNSDDNYKRKLMQMGAEVEAAMWQAETAFLSLVETFPQYESMERPS